MNLIVGYNIGEAKKFDRKLVMTFLVPELLPSLPRSHLEILQQSQIFENLWHLAELRTLTIQMGE